MTDMYLADASQVAEAAELIATFGEMAQAEAALRAGRSRDIGNHVTFCRWRQTGRLIAVMTSVDPIGTIH